MSEESTQLESFYLNKYPFELLVDRYWATKARCKLYLQEIHKRLKEEPQDLSCGCE